MSFIERLPVILEESRRQYEEMRQGTPESLFRETERIGNGRKPKGPYGNILARGDNAVFMSDLLNHKEMTGRIRLIYIDPPFFSKADYGTELKLKSNAGDTIPIIRQQAYHDTWEDGMEQYLIMLGTRFHFMRDLLTSDGALFVHLDWHAVHYVKVILDEIFGEKNFINEIIWHYKSGGVSKRQFAKKHDTILFYAKSPSYYFQPQQEKSYNRGYKPYRFKGVKEYKDELGWYTMVNRKDVWQLDMVGRTSAERTGYVTQKPEALIRRMLESCTEEGDLCADFFGGSGTLAATAEKMGRSWISCDSGKLATINSQKRLIEAGAGFSLYEPASESLALQEGIPKALVTWSPSPINDTTLLQIHLVGYGLTSLEAARVEPKYVPVLQSVLEEDPLQLVDYWSIDLDPKDGVHMPVATFCKGHDEIQSTYETLGKRVKSVGIKVVDIFGNCGFLSVEKGETV